MWTRTEAAAERIGQQQQAAQHVKNAQVEMELAGLAKPKAEADGGKLFARWIPGWIRRSQVDPRGSSPGGSPDGTVIKTRGAEVELRIR